jgi:hypothetical protein
MDKDPTPITEGPAFDPSPTSPWHEAQFAAKRALPSAICVAEMVASDAEAVDVSAA